MNTNCTSSLARICAIGGRCILNLQTNQEVCECFPGFGPDSSLFHAVVPDCSLPTTAYLGMFIYQTLTSFTVFYRLFNQSRLSKGLLRELTLSWMVAVFALWMLIAGLLFQGGYFEMSAVGVCLAVCSVVNAAYLLLKLLVEARFAMEMQSSERASKYLAICKYLTMLLFIGSAISQIVTCRTSLIFNLTMYVWTGLIIFFLFVLSVVIIYHDQKFMGSIRLLLKDPELNNRVGPDERPALLARLKLFQTMVLLIDFVVGPGLCLVAVIVGVYGNFPLMWAVLIIIVQIFVVVGLLLDRLNSMIQSFQKAKEDHGAILRNNNNTSDHPNSSIPLYQSSMNLFVYIHPKQQPVGHDTIIRYLCGKRFALFTSRIVVSRVSVFIIHALAPCIVSFALFMIVTGDKYFSVGYAAIIVIALAVPFIGLPITSTLSLKMLAKAFTHSSSFQLRVVLALTAFVSASACISFDLRTLLLLELFIASAVTYIIDALSKEKLLFLVVILFNSTTIPFAIWFILTFDVIEGRKNMVLNGYFSVYNFAIDINAILVWCTFLDGVMVMKYGMLVFIHFKAPVKLRVIPVLAEESEQILYEGETDFSKDKIRRSSTASQNGKRRNNARILKTYVKSVVIRENDSIICHVFGRIQNFDCSSLPTNKTNYTAGEYKANTLLRIVERYPRLFAALTGIAYGGSIIVWIVLIIPKLIPEFTSLFVLFFFVLPMLIFRFLFKSKIILIYLMKRIEFFFDFAVSVVGFAFFGISFGWTLSVVPGLISFWLVFIDWRTSDAFVNPRSLSPYYVFSFIPSVTPLFLLPILVYFRYIQVNTDSYVLIQPFGEAAVAIATNVSDVFTLESPPNSVFSRFRFSQILLDVMLIFGVKVVFDFIQRLALHIHNGETILLSFITCPISPKYCDFDERGSTSDVIWDIDGRSLEDMQSNTKKRNTGEDQQLQAKAVLSSPKLEALPSVALGQKIVIDEKEPELNFGNLKGPGWD